MGKGFPETPWLVAEWPDESGGLLSLAHHGVHTKGHLCLFQSQNHEPGQRDWKTVALFWNNLV